MGKVIAVIGNKGGTGKTTISHLLAHGLGLYGKSAISVLTDETREPLLRQNRRYVPLDARTPVQLERIMERIHSLPTWIGVIDGGGNRAEMDAQLYSLADLVLLPFRDSHEDIRTVLNDLETFPNAWGLPSQWPTNAWQQMAAERNIDELMPDYRPRLLEPVYSVSSSKLLLQSDTPFALPTVLNNMARRLAMQVLELLEIPLVEDGVPPPDSAQ
ncbi:MAG: hypothetical protein KGZ83_04090 [Sulfuricella sp.]|nr:hypothetical protein [Sulfuricella sp.]